MNNFLDRLSQALLNVGDSFFNIIPNIVMGVVILIVGWLIAKVLAKITQTILVKVGIDKLMDKIQAVDIFSKITVKISEVAGKLIYWLVIFTTFMVIAEVMEIEALQTGIAGLLSYLPRIISAVLFFVMGALLANMIRTVINVACNSMGLIAGKFISNFVFYFLLILISISALNQAGVDTDILSENITNAMMAVFLAFAIGYGIGSKDIMANILASFYSKNKFGIGQTIRVEDVEGKIVAKDSTSIVLDAGDRRVVLPISKLLNSKVEVM